MEPLSLNLLITRTMTLLRIVSSDMLGLICSGIARICFTNVTHAGLGPAGKQDSSNEPDDALTTPPPVSL